MQAKDGDLCCFDSLCPSLQYFCKSGHTLPAWLNLLGCTSCLSEGNVLWMLVCGGHCFVLAEFMVPWRWEDITAKQLKADPGNAAGYILVPKTSMLLLASLIILQISNSNLCPDVFYESQQLERMKTHCRCCICLLLSSSSLQLQFVCLWMVIAEWKDCRSSFWCKDEFIQHIVVGIWISAENIISPN